MKRAILIAVLALAGCATMDRIIQPRVLTPEERAQQMYLAYIGLQLMQAGQPVVPPAQIYVIDGRQIVCTQTNNVVVCN